MPAARKEVPPVDPTRRAAARALEASVYAGASTDAGVARLQREIANALGEPDVQKSARHLATAMAVVDPDLLGDTTALAAVVDGGVDRHADAAAVAMSEADEERVETARIVSSINGLLAESGETQDAEGDEQRPASRARARAITTTMSASELHALARALPCAPARDCAALSLATTNENAGAAPVLSAAQGIMRHYVARQWRVALWPKAAQDERDARDQAAAVAEINKVTLGVLTQVSRAIEDGETAVDAAARADAGVDRDAERNNDAARIDAVRQRVLNVVADTVVPAGWRIQTKPAQTAGVCALSHRQLQRASLVEVSIACREGARQWNYEATVACEYETLLRWSLMLARLDSAIERDAYDAVGEATAEIARKDVAMRRKLIDSPAFRACVERTLHVFAAALHWMYHYVAPSLRAEMADDRGGWFLVYGTIAPGVLPSHADRTIAALASALPHVGDKEMTLARSAAALLESQAEQAREKRAAAPARKPPAAKRKSDGKRAAPRKPAAEKAKKPAAKKKAAAK